jgi:hypothetical protein
LEELATGPFQAYSAILQHVCSVGYFQSTPNILLDQEDGDPLITQPLDDAEDFHHQ